MLECWVEEPPEIRLPSPRTQNIQTEEALQIIQKNKAKRKKEKKTEEKEKITGVSANKKRLQLSGETQKLAPHGRTATRPHQLFTGGQLPQETTRKNTRISQASIQKTILKGLSNRYGRSMHMGRRILQEH